MSLSFRKTGLVTAVAIVCAASGRAAVAISTVTAYTQTFDGMGTPATISTASTLPTDFKADTQTTARTLGTYALAGTTLARAGAASLSTTAANGSYNFGAGTTSLGGSDRAAGFLSSGTATATGNLYLQMVNNTGASVTGFTISYNVEKYRGGSNAAGFRVQLFYSTDGATWTSAGNGFLTSFAADANNNGFATAPGTTTAITNQTLAVTVPDGGNFFLAWSYSVSTGTTTTNAQALAIDDISILGQANTSTNPTGVGAAAPSSVQTGNSTLLTVNVTPGTNPASTGLGVTADLTSIGGSATQQFFDDGTNGDVSAGDNIFSFNATVNAATSAGGKTLPFSISDAQPRTGSGNISLTVTPLSTPPSGVGTANPNSLLAGASTLLTVTVASGTNPASTGVAVKVDLTSIGGTAAQAFFDDGTNGDVAPGDGIFSFGATVGAAISPGSKSLPASITDAQLRTGATSISLTVQSPPAPTTVKISQVYGGGGNSGATYTNDFIELFNASTSPVDISAWSIQQQSAGSTAAWNVGNLCAANSTCIIQPGHYYLVQEAAGLNGTTALPTADITGGFTMGAGSGKIALVNNTTALTGACPASAGIADLMGYGAANCSETNPTAAINDNFTAAVRKGNGCTDTNNNANDFVLIGPIPRNSASPANTCGVAGQLSGVGTATPASVDPGGVTLLSVRVTPGTSSTGITVTGDLSSVGGSATQTFFDDGTNGDATAGDGTFTFKIAVAVLPTGAKNIVTTVKDAQGGNVTVPITITIQSPTCGVERWSVKVGTDNDAGLVNLNPVRTSIKNLRSFVAPVDPPGPPLNSRVQPAETTVWLVNGLLTIYKLETDVDYHIVLQDPDGNTMVTEIPSPACDGTTSPFDAAVAAVRAKFDAKFTAISTFQTANVPVQMRGVGFFDFIHGQTGVAPNGIELHPILDVSFTTQSTTVLSSSLNPATFGQNVNLTATVTFPSGTPTGNLSFFDGTTLLGAAGLDGTGKATITATGLTAGPHTLKASYEGDSNASESSGTLSQVVNQATPVLTWSKPAAVNFGSALSGSQLNATANVPGTFVYTPPAGTVLPVGNGQTLSAAFTPTSTNYANGSVSTTIDVLAIQPPSGPSINPTRVFSRDGSNNVVVQLTLTNVGGTAANNVMLTSLKVGAITAPGLPIAVGTIAPNSSATVTINMGNPVGASGAASSMTLAGTYSGGGNFSASARITLP